MNRALRLWTNATAEKVCQLVDEFGFEAVAWAMQRAEGRRPPPYLFGWLVTVLEQEARAPTPVAAGGISSQPVVMVPDIPSRAPLGQQTRRQSRRISWRPRPAASADAWQ